MENEAVLHNDHGAEISEHLRDNVAKTEKPAARCRDIFKALLADSSRVRIFWLFVPLAEQVRLSIYRC